MTNDDSHSFDVSIPLTTKNNQASLSLTDSDKDGNYESLNYNGTSITGEDLRIARDDNLDGVIDRVFDFKSNKTSVQISGIWIELENVGRDDDGLIVYKGNIRGKEKRIIFKNYPYLVVDLPANIKREPQPTK